jgi:hypothetical protein
VLFFGAAFGSAAIAPMGDEATADAAIVAMNWRRVFIGVRFLLFDHVRKRFRLQAHPAFYDFGIRGK